MQAEKIHVRDVMRTDLVKLSSGTPVPEAITTLTDAGIRGAPVVDASGHVVGVVSVGDLLEASAAEEGELGAARHRYYMADPLEELFDEDPDEFSMLDDYSPETLPGGTVSEWMKTSVLSVGPNSTLRHACTMMAEHRVHRLMVIEDDKLIGILSTFDVVICVAERG